MAIVNEESLTEQQKNKELYSYFKGEDKLKKASKKDIIEFANLIHHTFANGEFPEFKRMIKIKGRWFGLEPDIEQMEGGAFLDIDSLIQQPTELVLHKIMSVLYRPVTLKVGRPNKEGTKYTISSFVGESNAEKEARENLFLHEFDYHHAAGVIDFFWKSTV